MDELIPGLLEEVARECLVRVSYNLFGVAGSVSRLWKRELESTTFHRMRRSRMLTRKLAAFVQAEPPADAASAGGPAHKYCCTPTLSYRLSLLDPLAGEWRTLPPVPGLPRSRLPLFCQIAAVGRKLIVVGGWDPDTWAPSDAVYVYDFLSERWGRGARMPAPRRSFFACSAGGGTSSTTVFVAGGHDEEKNALRSAMAYDAEADEWAPLPDMAVERDECRGAFLNGGFLVVGGYPTERQGQFCKSAETFDVATWRWGAVEEDRLEDATCPMTCVADGDGDHGKFYLVRSGHVVVEDCGKWKEVAEVPEDAAVSTQLMTCQGKLLLVGSGSHGGGRVAYLLEIATDVDGGKKSKLTWHKMEVPEEYSGHVQAAACLEI